MKLHITVLASSLALAMPALAKDIPLSQAESIAKSVTPTRRASPLMTLRLNG
ncbi:phosphatase [Salmonella enterica subsp. enterica serovar Poona]|nr:phosphatase [Salmonella enterica subsp. enterica serovar Poona]